MFEKIIFNIIAISLFTITFLKLVKKNDATYIYLLITEFIGLVINFIELFVGSSFGWFFKMLMYLLAIIIPGVLFVIEKVKKVDFAELFRLVVATIYEKTGKREDAKKILTKFLKKNPNSYIMHKKLAELYEKEEKYEAMAEEYRKVTEINPKDFSSSYKLAVALNKNKQSEYAINVLQEILKQKPEEEKASNLLGDIYFEQERYKEAISVYMTALRYHPASYDLYYGLGMACTMINDFQRAKEFYEKAASINSMLYNAKLNLGQIALMYGDLDEAEKYFREASKKEDLEAGSYYYLSQIALLKGDEDKAKNYMNLAVQIDSKVYTQMQRDPIFAPIRTAITPPQKIVEEQVKTNTLTKREKRVNSHLVKTGMLIQGLSNEDLQVIRKRKEKQINKEKEERQKE